MMREKHVWFLVSILVSGFVGHLVAGPISRLLTQGAKNVSKEVR